MHIEQIENSLKAVGASLAETGNIITSGDLAKAVEELRQSMVTLNSCILDVYLNAEKE